jgi:hypothetical protein
MSAGLLRSVSPRLLCQDFLLETGVWIIGRAEQCDLVIEQRSVSRRTQRLLLRRAEHGYPTSVVETVAGLTANEFFAEAWRLLLGKTCV